MKAKQERRIAVYTVLCSGHILVVVFRGSAGVEHVIVSEKEDKKPEKILHEKSILDEIWAIIPLNRATKEFSEFTSSLKDELDKLICREGVYRAR